MERSTDRSGALTLTATLTFTLTLTATLTVTVTTAGIARVKVKSRSIARKRPRDSEESQRVSTVSNARSCSVITTVDGSADRSATRLAKHAHRPWITGLNVCAEL